MGLDEGVNKANQLLDKYVSIVTSKKEFLFKQLLNAVLVFVILLVFGCLDFASLKFHFEFLGQWDFWSAIILKTVAGVMAFNLGINFLLDTEIQKNGTLQENIRRYDIFNKNKTKDFEYYVNKIYNVQNKVRAYISAINRKIFLLNRFSRRYDRLLYSSELPERQAEKEKNHYCRVRSELEKLKSEEFINKNLETIKVRYIEVDPAIFELEIDGSQKIKRNRVRGSIALGRAKASSSIVLSTVMITSFFTALGLELYKDEFETIAQRVLHYILKIATDIGVIVWQISHGLLKTRSIVSSQLTTPFVNRNSVLIDYYQWRLSKNEVVPQKVLDEITPEIDDDSDVIEIDEELLEKIKNPQ